MAAAPRAHADLEDLLLDPFTTIIGAVDPGLASAAAEPALSVASAPASGLAASADAATNFTVPLTVVNGTEPTVDLSVNGGTSIPVLVDSGSSSLVVPITDINLFHGFNFPTGLGIGQFSSGEDYLYLTFTEPVSFTNADGVVTTAPTSVEAAVLGFPQPFGTFAASDGVDGVLGIGVNTVGTSSVVSALPGDLGQGVLVNEPGGALEFGPNPLTPVASLTGAPYTTVDVSVDGGAAQPVTAVVDSGGVYGSIPASLLNDGQSSGIAPPGTLITVSTPGGTELYSYTTTAADVPTVTSGGYFNTGSIPFSAGPIYIADGGAGTTTFDK